MTDPTTTAPFDRDDDYEPQTHTGIHYAKGTKPSIDVRTHPAKSVTAAAVSVVGWRHANLTIQAEDPEVLRMIGNTFHLAARELEAEIANATTDQEK